MTLSAKDLRSRRAGCFLGQCLGDACGSPVEGFPPQLCAEYLKSSLDIAWHSKNEEAVHGIGQYTDDSQLARELLISLLSQGDFDPQDYAKRIQDLFQSGRVVGRGLACDRAVKRLLAGVSWEESGCPPPDAGNGTAMRAAPVGMVFFDQSEKMIEVAREQGWITHRDPRCDAGSNAIAGGVALAIPGRVEPGEFCGQLSEWMALADSGFAELVRHLPDKLSEPPEQAVRSIALAGLTPGRKPDWPGISPFVVPSVLWSLYCFLRTPDDYYESIRQAIACGGDVDTTAAMTGAISGAYLGVEALPGHMVARINDRGRWRADKLLTLVDLIAARF